MQGCSSEGSESILLNPSLKIVHITVLAGKCQVSHIYEDLVLHCLGKSLSYTSIECYEIVHFLLSFLRFAC